MSEKRIEELAALDLAGALDESERQELQQLLAQSNQAALRYARQFNELGALLLVSQTETHNPPAALKEKILGRIAATAPAQTTSAPDAGLKFLSVSQQGDWQPFKIPGAWVKLLSFDAERGYAVVLGKLDAGVHFPAHQHIHAEQIFVLTGDLFIGDKRMDAGDFHHADAGTAHGVNRSETGCTILAVISTADLQAQMA